MHSADVISMPTSSKKQNVVCYSPQLGSLNCLGADGDFLVARAHVAARWYCHLYSKVSRKFLVLEVNFCPWCGRKQ